MLEVVLRWGDDTIDVQYVDDYEVAGIPLVRHGQILGEPRGHIGLVSYAIEPATRPARSLPYTRGDDHRVLPYLVVALVAHLALWQVATREHPVAPVEATTVSSADAARPLRRARVTAPPAYAANPIGVDTPKRQPIASRGKRGAAAKVGASTGTARTHSAAAAIDATRVAGMLDSLTSDRIRVVTGKLDLAGAMANADLGGQVAMTSSFGVSFTGDGGGGGGVGWATIGTGRYGSLSAGAGDGMRYTGRHYDGGYYPIKRHLVIPTLRITKLAVEGEVDPAIVRRYVKRNLSKLTYCFEKEALRTPSLDKAPAEVAFTIMGDGHVDDATATIQFSDVATCITGVVNAIDFPRSSGSFSFVSLGLAYERPTGSGSVAP